MRGLLKLIYVEFKLFFREPQAAFFTLAFPLMMLVAFTPHLLNVLTIVSSMSLAFRRLFVIAKTEGPEPDIVIPSAPALSAFFLTS